MAEKKTTQMASFYSQCRAKGYTDMTDATQSLKAKVIATDLGLKYKNNIVAFYEEAKKCHETVEREKAIEAENRRIAWAQADAEAKRRAVDGELLLTLYSSLSESRSDKVLRIFMRPDRSVYCTVNNGKKIEGAPTIGVAKGGVLALTYHPSKAIFTGASVGGIATGGIHHTQEYVSSRSHQTGTGDVSVSIGDTSFTVAIATPSPYTADIFRRDSAFGCWVKGGKIICQKDDELSNSYMSAALSGNADYTTRMNMISLAVDKARLDYSTCVSISTLLGRIVNLEFPPSDEEVYAKACQLAESETSGPLKEAKDLFTQILDYKDSRSRKFKVAFKYNEVLQAEKERAILEKEQRHQQRAKTLKKSLIIGVPLVILCIAAYFIVTGIVIPNQKYARAEEQYARAEELLAAGDYDGAMVIFEELGDYKDALNRAEEARYAKSEKRYANAEALLAAKDYDGAIKAFELLEDFEDAADRVNEVKYTKAEALLDAEKYYEAIAVFEELGDYKDSAARRFEAKRLELAAAEVGDIVCFGNYEQDNNTSNGKEDIEWLVLEVIDGKTLVISKYALDHKPYNTSKIDVTWETCTLRKWLNNDFINAAFSADEKAMIPTVTVSTDKNPVYSTNPGKATQDQVFLFSITEANKYFNSDRARQCEATDYAVANGAYVDSSNGNCWWWLRSPGFKQYDATNVFDDGDVSEHGYSVIYGFHAVRPALWIDLSVI